MKTTTEISPEDKIFFWGDGPWVNDPDYAEFEFFGYKCVVRRQFFPDEIIIAKALEERLLEKPENSICKNFKVTDGYFCGYVLLPKNHPWNKTDGEAPEGIECHGGCTFSEVTEEGFWVGFDCGQSHDVVPGWIEIRKKIDEDVLGILFSRTYKDLNFCINECQSIAQQAAEAAK